MSATGSLLIIWLWLTILRLLPNPISPRNREMGMMSWCFLSGFLLVAGGLVQEKLYGPAWKDSKAALALIVVTFVLVVTAWLTLMFTIAWAHPR